MSTSNPFPDQITSFIGREHEIAEVTRLLATTRLLTLTGAGGAGKTRLALRLADDLRARFADGVVFVPLAAVSDPDLVVPRIVQAIGIDEAASLPALSLLTEFLADKQMLLVLDNFEQVAAAGAQIAALLGEAPGVKALVTSRAPLHVYGEQEFVVPPLELPQDAAGLSSTGLLDYASICLFVSRARAVQPGFTLTAENAAAVVAICRRLDGLPLAIELAAARAKILSPAALLTRLAGAPGLTSLRLLTGGPQDRPARQQTLRAAIDWSHALLDPPTQALFRRLAVFVGGFTLEAAEQVGSGQWAAGRDEGSAFRVQGSGTGEEAFESAAEHATRNTQHAPLHPQSSVLSTFDALATLVDQSLLRQQEGPGGEPRFYMLETIREYALERLEGSGEAAALREAHARYYRALMIDAAPELRGPQTAVWLDRLEADHDNLRAALAWALAQGDAGVALRLAETVAWFWSLRGYLDEGRGWLARALALPGAAARTDLRARALNWAGVLAYRQSDARAARALFEEAAAIFREVNDAGGLGYSLALLGVVLLYGGDPAGARALLEESVRLFRATDDRWGLSLALRNFGEVARSQGDPAARRAALEESIALFRTIGDAWGLALASNTLGEAARLDGDYPRAAALFQDSLALFRELGDKQGTAWCLAELAAVAGGLGQPERAVRLFGATAALLDAIGARLDPVDRAAYDRNVAAVRAQLDPAAFAAAWDAGAALPFEAVLALATEIAPADPRPPAAPAARPAEPAPAPSDPDALTPREIDVLRLVAAGLTDAEVAARLYLSPRTVQTHLRSIYSKLEITSRSAATRYAIEHHFV